MTIHTHFLCVCLCVATLCGAWCTDVQAQTRKPQSAATERRLVVIDTETGQPVEGAWLWAGGEVVVSSAQGILLLPRRVQLPDTLLVQHLAYRAQRVPAARLGEQAQPYVLRLVPVARGLDEVVVTGERTAGTRNTVGSKIGTEDLQRALGTSLSALLEQVGGVSSISTGTTVAKPVIQGMYGNRILLLNNGVRQTGQQWGADHAPELDMNGSGSILVVKGSDAVRYGPDALGGIILLEQASLPYGKPGTSGHVSTLYGSNGRRYLLTGEAEGSLGRRADWAWRLQGTYANAGDRSAAHYLLNNTGTREQHCTATLGYHRGPLRAEAFYSRYDHRIGILFSAQMGSEDLLAERIRLGQPVHTDPFTRSIVYPSQRVTHQTAIGKVEYVTPRAGTFFWQSAWQKDDRRENRLRRLNRSGIPAVALYLTSYQHLLRWRLERKAWQTEAGAQWMQIDNHSQGGTGVVPVIPNYTETQTGLYLLHKRFYRHGGAEAGIRMDGQETRATGYDWTGQPYGGTRRFANLTGTLGAHYQPTERWTLTTHVGVAWRAPHVHELYSNGNELGSGMFVRGDSALHSERSCKWISSLTYRTPTLHLRIDGYLQWIRGYIYDEPQREMVTVLSGSYPVFQYRQTPAFFRGVDVDLRWVPSAAWQYRTVASVIRAHERGTGRYLPYIPPFRLQQELAWQHRSGRQLQWRLAVRHRFTARQTRFDPATDLIDHTPPAYHLFGADASVERSLSGGRSLRLAVSADNLLNKEYKEYTNRSRYYAHDMGRDVRCSLHYHF